MHFFTKSTTKTSIESRSSELSSPSTSVLDSASEVRVVTGKDYKAAAACLANAFSKDEVAGYFLNCPDTAEWPDERKWKLHVQIMEALTYAHLKFGVVHAVGDLSINDSYDAVSLWMPPGTNFDSYLAMMKNGVLWKVFDTSRKLSKEGRARMFKEFFPLLETTKAAVMKERDASSWYLVYLGTHARARGRGLAKKLVAEVTGRADIENQACYLESSNAVNVPIYRKMGFEVCKQIALGRDGKKFLLDVMVREPAGTQAVAELASPAEHLSIAQTHIAAA